MDRRFFAALIALQLLLFAVDEQNTVRAQPIERYRNFVYDTLFHIGAHQVPWKPELYRDSLGLDFTLVYSFQNPAKLTTPLTWRDTLDQLLYFQNDSTPPTKTIRLIQE